MLKIIFFKIIDFLSSNTLLFISLLIFNVYYTQGLDFFLIDMCIALLVLIFLILFTNRINFSLLLVLLSGIFISSLHSVKMQFWGKGFEISDLRYFKSLIQFSEGLFSSYSSILMPFILQFIIVLIFSVIVFFRSKTLISIKNNIVYYIVRFLIIALNLLLSYAFTGSMTNHNSRFNNYLDAKYSQKLNSAILNSTTYGYDGINNNMGIFASSLFSLRFDNIANLYKLNNISSEKILQIVKNKNKQSTYANLGLNKLPDIISVLHESTFDVSDFLQSSVFHSKVLETKANAIKVNFLKQDEFTVAHGNAFVKIFGGNSQVTEFQVISGLDVNLFAWQGQCPNIFLAPKVKTTLAKTLKNLGYKTILLYPTVKKFTNADEAFIAAGVDQVYDIKDFPELLTEEERKSNWPIISDEKICQMAKIILETKVDTSETAQPIILFVATMSNHGMHANVYEDKLGFLNIFGKNISIKLNDYIDRLKKTDIAFTEFSNYLMQRRNPTMLVQFGDHKPSFEGEMIKLIDTIEGNSIIINNTIINSPSNQFLIENKIKKKILKTESNNHKYKTFYNIRTNFKVHDMKRYTELDIEFLPALVLDLIGINYTNEFFIANSHIRELCNGSMKFCKYDPNSTKESVKKLHTLINSYKKLAVEQIEQK